MVASTDVLCISFLGISHGVSPETKMRFAEVGQLAAGEIVHVLEAADIIRKMFPKKLGWLLPKMIPCWM